MSETNCQLCGMEWQYHGQTCCGGELRAPAGSGQRTLEQLVREVMSWHSNPDSPEYNQCDKDPCAWCTDAQAALERFTQALNRLPRGLSTS